MKGFFNHSYWYPQACHPSVEGQDPQCAYCVKKRERFPFDQAQ